MSFNASNNNNNNNNNSNNSVSETPQTQRHMLLLLVLFYIFRCGTHFAFIRIIEGRRISRTTLLHFSFRNGDSPITELLLLWMLLWLRDVAPLARSSRPSSVRPSAFRSQLLWLTDAKMRRNWHRRRRRRLRRPRVLATAAAAATTTTPASTATETTMTMGRRHRGDNHEIESRTTNPRKKERKKERAQKSSRRKERKKERKKKAFSLSLSLSLSLLFPLHLRERERERERWWWWWSGRARQGQARQGKAGREKQPPHCTALHCTALDVVVRACVCAYVRRCVVVVSWESSWKRAAEPPAPGPAQATGVPASGGPLDGWKEVCFARESVRPIRAKSEPVSVGRKPSARRDAQSEEVEGDREIEAEAEAEAETTGPNPYIYGYR